MARRVTAERLRARSVRLARLAERADAAARALAAARLLVVVAALACFAVAWRMPAWRAPAAVAGAGATIAFLALVRAHASVRRRHARAAACAASASRDVARADGEWRVFPATGEGLAAPGREADLAADLALLGHASLFQLLSRCTTPWGEGRLASLLLAASPARDLAARQQAAGELAGRAAWRRRFEAEGAIARPTRDAETLASELAAPSVFDRRPWLGPAAAGLGIVTVAQIIAAGSWSLPTLAWPCVALNVLITALAASRLQSEYEPLLDRHEAVTACAGMLGVLGRARFRTAPLRGLAARARGSSGEDAASALARLSRILDALGLRRNAMWWPVQALTLWDAWQVARLARWKRRHGAAVADWLLALGDAEALASFGAHAEVFGLGFPDVGGSPPLVASALAHPLLPQGRAIANDLSLTSTRRVLVLTGSNMSGKSTLLRAAGLNAVLALAGGPVHAASMAMRPCRVLTSIRVTDALDEGVSLFYAEVRRLKAIVVAAEDPAGLPVLFLVDEILRGTNARERHLASRALVTRLAGGGAAGIVTSHDVELTSIAASVPAVVNGHFREEIRDGRMTFDYLLREGPVTTTNALAILKLEGLEVPEA